MTILLMFLIVIAAFMFVALVSRIWRPKIVDRIIPTPKHSQGMADIVRLKRRSGETLSDFDARILVAFKELNAASNEFMLSAERLGHFDVASETYRSEAEQVNAVEFKGRVIMHRLPQNHPSAVRYAKAKRGDA